MSISDSTETINVAFEESYTSKYNFRKFRLIWKIPDLEFTFRNLSLIESPRFPSTKFEKVKWYIQIETTELREGNTEIFRMFLRNTDNSKKYYKVQIQFFDSSRIIHKFVNYADRFEVADEHHFWNLTGDELYKYSLNNEKALPKKMTVICEIALLHSCRNIIDEPLAVPLNSISIAKQMECFFEDQNFKDFKFIVDEKEFSVHKTILALRSPVFAAMFRSKMSEELYSVVEIKDISSTTFQSMLQFIYTDEVQDLKDSALELFYAAEKYQLERLKDLCLNSLYNNMSKETVVKIFEVADIFSVPKLKTKAGEYLVSCLKDVEDCEEFVNLLKTRPHLAVEIVKMQKKIVYENETYEDLSQDMKFELRL